MWNRKVLCLHTITIIKSMNFVKNIFFIYVLSFLSFFSPQFLPFKIEEQLSKLIIYSLFIVFSVCVIGNKNKEKNTYDKCFVLILWGFTFSIFMASTQHSEQSLPVSIMATLPYIVPFSTFFLLKKSRFNIDWLEKVFIIVGVLNVIMVLQLWGFMPNQLFGGLREEDDGRGIRIGVEGDIFKVLLLFYSIYKFKTTKKIIYAGLICLCFITVFLSLTRQVMAISTFLAIIYYLKDLKFYKKILIAALSVCILISVIQMPYFQDLISVSERQIEQDAEDENIRVKAWRYYLDESQEGLLTRIFGNGCYSYGNSQYGYDERRNQLMTLCFPSDVSLVSFYWFFGILGITGIIMIFVKTFRLDIPERYGYLKFVIYYIMLASIASGPLLYYSQNIVLVVVCYLLGKINYLYGNDNRNNNFKL